MKKKFIKTPLKGVYVHGAKDVGTRTVNLLMGEHAGEYVRGDIMDANAVIQAFDELKGNVDNDHDSLEEVVDELHNLRDATDQSFEVFQEKAEEETANRIQGDKTLDQKIDQKERESKERDNVLQQNIDTEKQERVNADTQLRNDLNTEINRAKAKENALASDIQAEATKRENDDNTIKDNLNAEVTRATAKENEIKAEVDVINGDSTTEGSFRKAIADVVGAAPEAYDTLKEIADKLNENDDLHAAINDAIATKATTVALNEEITRAKAAEAENKAEIAAEAARAKQAEGNNALAIQNEASRATTAETAINEAVSTEVERAKGQEAYLQNLVNTKADTTALEGAKTELDKKISDETARATDEEDELRSLIITEYNRATDSEKSIADDLNGKLAQKADTTTLNEQIDTLNAAISAKQDAGNYIPYDDQYEQAYVPDRTLRTIGNNIETYSDASGNNRSTLQPGNILVEKDGYTAKLNTEGLTIRNAYKDIYIDEDGLRIFNSTGNHNIDFVIQKQGISLKGGDNNHVLTSNSSTIDITEYALKRELPTVPTKVSQLANDSNFITAADIDFTPYATIEALTAVEQKVSANTTAIANINKSNGIPYNTSITNYYETNKPFYIKCDNDHTAYINPYSGIKVANSDTSYVNITPSIMRLSNGNASCEINEYIGGMQCLSGTSDDSNGLKLSYDGLRIGKKSDINTNNNELISISRQTATGSSTFKVKDNAIETNKVRIDEYGITNDKKGATNTDILYLSHSVGGNAILVKENSDLSIGAASNIYTNPYWKFGFYGAEFNASDNKKRIDIQGVGFEYANIFGIKLKTNVERSSDTSTWDNPCQIENNSDYVSFSKKIKVSDIITDTTTDSSLNTVLSKKQDKITPTAEIELTSIDMADIESLRSIVKALATELNTLGLIKLKSAEETA